MRAKTAADADFCCQAWKADESVHISGFYGVFDFAVRFAIPSQPSTNNISWTRWLDLSVFFFFAGRIWRSIGHQCVLHFHDDFDSVDVLLACQRDHTMGEDAYCMLLNLMLMCLRVLQSNRLSGSMYECDWYGGDKRKFTNALHIFMACTQHPIMMRTVFLEMNLVNFINVSRTKHIWVFWRMNEHLSFNKMIADIESIVQLLYSLAATRCLEMLQWIW